MNDHPHDACRMPSAGGDDRICLLDAGDLAALRAAADAGDATTALGAYPRIARLRDALNAPGSGQLAVVVDDPEIRRTREFASLPRLLSAALDVASASVANACIVVLGDALADGTAAIGEAGTLSLASLDTLADAVAETVFEVRRRVDTYFEQEPLALPAETAGAACLLTAEAVLAWLATQASPGLHVVHGDRRIAWRELAESVAQGCPFRREAMPTRPAPTPFSRCSKRI
ncbi:hypothetical protein OWT26_16110 [Burkholderia sp. 1A5]